MPAVDNTAEFLTIAHNVYSGSTNESSSLERYNEIRSALTNLATAMGLKRMIGSANQEMDNRVSSVKKSASLMYFKRYMSRSSNEMNMHDLKHMMANLATDQHIAKSEDPEGEVEDESGKPVKRNDFLKLMHMYLEKAQSCKY